MNPDELYHFIFETYEGIGLSIIICLLICVMLAFITEHRARRKFRDRPKSENDFDFFTEIDDEEDEDEIEAGKPAKKRADAKRPAGK